MSVVRTLILFCMFSSLVFASVPKVVVSFQEPIVAGEEITLFVTVLHDGADPTTLHYIKNVTLFLDGEIEEGWGYNPTTSPEMTGKFPPILYKMRLEEGQHEIRAVAECSVHLEGDPKIKTITVVKSVEEAAQQSKTDASGGTKKKSKGVSVLYYILFMIVIMLFVVAVVLVLKIQELKKRKK